jgi:hypothetical protein
MYLGDEELMAGGEIRFVMSPKAEATWRRRPLEMPFSMSTPQ